MISLLLNDPYITLPRPINWVTDDLSFLNQKFDGRLHLITYPLKFIYEGRQIRSWTMDGVLIDTDEKYLQLVNRYAFEIENGILDMILRREDHPQSFTKISVKEKIELLDLSGYLNDRNVTELCYYLLFLIEENINNS